MILQELLQLGESYHQEFKETIDKLLVREVCAFANASGKISNLGGLPSGLSRESFGHKSVTRNLLIADLLHRVGYIEKISTGIRRIRDAVAETDNCSVKFEIDEHWLTSVFYRNKSQRNNVTDNTNSQNRQQSSHQPISSDISSDITSAKILELLKSTPTLSARQISEILQISTRAADKIKREGSKKYGYWKLQ